MPDGPVPRAVVQQNYYDFGIIGVGDEHSHTFTIRNEGEAPLELRQGETTCTCTIGSLEREQLPPGDSATVTLQWTADKEHQVFRQGATVWTNDPEKPELRFIVSGRVEPLYHLTPQVSWSLGQINNRVETIVTGKIFSRARDSFELNDIIVSDPQFYEARWAPLEAPELQRLEARSGYALTAKVKPGLPQGQFRGALTLMTDFDEELQPALMIEGYVPGRIRIVGSGWSPRKNRLILGTFASSEGKQAHLLIYAQDEGETDFRILDHFADYDSLEIGIEEEQVAEEDQHLFRVTFTIPPSQRVEIRRKEEAIPVTLVTNDTEIPEIKFTVSFVAY